MITKMLNLNQSSRLHLDLLQELGIKMELMIKSLLIQKMYKSSMIKNKKIKKRSHILAKKKKKIISLFQLKEWKAQFPINLKIKKELIKNYQQDHHQPRNYQSNQNQNLQIFLKEERESKKIKWKSKVRKRWKKKKRSKKRKSWPTNLFQTR